MPDEWNMIIDSAQDRFPNPPEVPFEEEEEEEDTPSEEDDYDDDDALADDDDGDDESLPGPHARRKEIDAAPLASARNIPRPTTSLMAPPSGHVGSIRVSLVKDAYVPMDIPEIEKINTEQTSDARTPVMTIIEGILRDHGGPMSLDELTTKTEKYWNRPFPGSPYTKQEFIYTLVSNSEHIRVQS